MKAEKILEELGQKKILEFFKNYSSIDKKRLEEQLFSLDLQEMKNQRAAFLKEKALIEGDLSKKKKQDFDPLMECEYFSTKYIEEGKQSLNRGEVGVVILGGGMASRLKWDHPKGTFPVSRVKKKSIFQLFCEKVFSAQKKFGARFFLSIMTSSKTHEETVSFFRDNNYFGLDSSQVDFFQQCDLPFLDEKGDFVLEKHGKIVTGPDGNGDVFEIFKKRGVFEKFKKNGVKYVSVIPVDNPIADPFDEVFIGFHKKNRSEVSLIVLEKDQSSEKMGVVAKSNGKIKIIEYIQLSDEEKKEYKYLNTALFLVSMDFISKNNFILPFHFVKKAVKITDHQKTIEKDLWKAEKFIFDVLDYCEISPLSGLKQNFNLAEDLSSFGMNVICFDKHRCYGPLKNSSGKDSISDVQEAIYQKDRFVFSEISGKFPEDKIFELSMDFHYPTEELIKKWKGRDLPKSSYVET